MPTPTSRASTSISPRSRSRWSSSTPPDSFPSTPARPSAAASCSKRDRCARRRWWTPRARLRIARPRAADASASEPRNEERRRERVVGSEMAPRLLLRHVLAGWDAGLLGPRWPSS
eukprot:scaffold36337_cov118-Isochrysis_galbana.AAC.3